MLPLTRRAIALASLLLLIIVVAPAGTLATNPGPNGRITFMRFDPDGNFQVWVANPDLSHQVQLTHGPGSDAWFPSWSPDGKRIAFSSHRSDPDPTDDFEVSDVFTMRSDGTDVRKLTDSTGFNGNPSWSPDGRWLAYSSEEGVVPRKQAIFLVRSDGSAQPRQITTVPASSLGQELARFSPDGRQLVFNEVRTIETGDPDPPTVDQSALFTVRLDGSRLRRITPWAVGAADADWSPDGDHVVFAGRPAENGYIQNVGVVDADGRGLRILTRGDGVFGDGDAFRYQESFNPAWSPDGTKIIFVRATYTAAEGYSQGLQTMRPNGTGRVVLSTGEEHQPDWGTAAPIR
jgi:Tol biopolymer transport system component